VWPCAAKLQLLHHTGRDTLLLVKDLPVLLIRYLVILGVMVMLTVSVLFLIESGEIESGKTAAGTETTFGTQVVSVVSRAALPAVLLAGCVSLFHAVRSARSVTLSRLLLALITFGCVVGSAFLSSVADPADDREFRQVIPIRQIVYVNESFLYVPEPISGSDHVVVMLDPTAEGLRFSLKSSNEDAVLFPASPRKPGPGPDVPGYTRLGALQANLLLYAQERSPMVFIVSGAVAILLVSLYPLTRVSRWPLWNLLLFSVTAWGFSVGYSILNEPALIELLERFLPGQAVVYRGPLFLLGGAVLFQAVAFLQKPVLEWRRELGMK
jgi:hypothetical protein